jgi:hypothetical protein
MNGTDQLGPARGIITGCLWGLAMYLAALDVLLWVWR